jgi:feruloyl-CoA synthase
MSRGHGDQLKAIPYRDAGFMPVDLEIDHRADGVLTMRSRIPLPDEEWNFPRAFAEVAARQGDRTAIARRAEGGGEWQYYSYAELKRASDAIAQWLLDHPVQGPVMLVGSNSLAMAAFMNAAMAAGRPYAPVSLHYAMLGGDLGRLRHVISRVKPAVVLIENASTVGAAITSLDLGAAVVVTATPEAMSGDTVTLAEVLATTPRDVEAAIAALRPDNVAQYMMTSGSTGLSKLVALTFENLAANNAAGSLAIGEHGDLADRILNWMPWNHVAGGSAMRAALVSGAAFYVDDGKPMPGLFDLTLRNLKEIPVHRFLNVPAGYAMLADALEADDDLQKVFFSELKLMLYGGASLSQAVQDRIQALAIKQTGHRIMITSAYGATETTAGVTATYFYTDQVGLGIPLAGATLKLVPYGERYEVRVKGPSVMKGYLDEPEKTAAAFDDEGFYLMGDLATLIDPQDPGAGIAFAGRIAEEFKLATGAWVQGGALRDSLLVALSPLVAELVLCDDDRPYLTAMLWPSSEGVKSALGVGLPDALTSGTLDAEIASRLAAHNDTHRGASTRIARAVVLTTPPNPNAHEISDKASINRRSVMDNRADVLTGLFAEPPAAGVIVV